MCFGMRYGKGSHWETARQEIAVAELANMSEAGPY